MLQTLRDKTSGWIATVILGLLAIPFAFFGMEQYLFQNNADYAAKIEAPPHWWPSAPDFWPVRKATWQSEEVTTEEFRAAFEQARERARATQGDGFDARAFESVESKRAVLETLVDQAALRLYARQAGIGVGNEAVRREIESIPAFQVDGKFNAQRYQLALQSARTPQTPTQFDASIRQSLAQALVPTQVSSSAFVTPWEFDRLMALMGEKRDVSYVVLSQAGAAPAVPTDAELQAWYDANKDDYRAPEAVSIEYIELDAATLALPAEDGEAALRARYEQEKAKFTRAEQRLVSHVLVRAEGDGKAAEEKAKAIAAKARAAGADFATIARTDSDDVGSKAAGGDLGWIEKDQMPAPFEQAAFAAKAGDIVGPVRTDAGWHVLQVRDVKAGAQVSFEDARAELEKEAGESARDRAFNDLSGRIVDTVYRNPSTLEAAAAEAKVPVRKVGPFTRNGGEGIAGNPAVVRAAFAEAAIQDGTVTDPVDIGPNHVVLLRVDQHVPERTLPLADVRARVVADFQADRATKALQADADAILAKLRGGATLQAVAAERSLTPTDIAGIERRIPAPAPQATEAYFSTVVPKDGKPGYGSAVIPGSGVVVFSVANVQPGDIAQLPEAQRQMLRGELAQIMGAADTTGLVKALRERMKVQVVEARL